MSTTSFVYYGQTPTDDKYAEFEQKQREQVRRYNELYKAYSAFHRCWQRATPEQREQLTVNSFIADELPRVVAEVEKVTQ